MKKRIACAVNMLLNIAVTLVTSFICVLSTLLIRGLNPYLDHELQGYSGEDLVTLYSKRDKAELHQGEMKAASEFAFSSSSRKKPFYRGRPIEHEPCGVEDEIRPENCVRLQLYMLVHIGRCIMHGAPDPSSESEASDSNVAADATSLSDASETPVSKNHLTCTFILQLLKVGEVIVRSGRYIKVRIVESAVETILGQL